MFFVHKMCVLTAFLGVKQMDQNGCRSLGHFELPEAVKTH